METTKKNKSGLRSLLWILPLAGLLFLALAVWSVTERYSTQFLPGSTVMGIDCANMTIPQATAALTEAVDGTQVVLGDSSGIEIDRFPLDAFVEKDALAAAVKDAFVTQRSSARWYDWLMEGERSYSPAPLAGLTDQQVSEVIQTLHFAGEGRVEPKNAHVELTDSGYVVVDAEPAPERWAGRCAR